MEGGAISAELEVEGQQTFSREGVTPWTVVNQKKKTFSVAAAATHAQFCN